MALSSAAHAVEGTVHRRLAEADLTVSQFSVLHALWESGRMSQGRLAERIRKSSGNLTTVLDNLARRELIARERDPFDRRMVQVDLTDAGRGKVRDALPRHLRQVVEAFAGLTPDERERLAALCRKVARLQRDASAPRDASDEADEPLLTKGAPT